VNQCLPAACLRGEPTAGDARVPVFVLIENYVRFSVTMFSSKSALKSLNPKIIKFHATNVTTTQCNKRLSKYYQLSVSKMVLNKPIKNLKHSKSSLEPNTRIRCGT